MHPPFSRSWDWDLSLTSASGVATRDAGGKRLFTVPSKPPQTWLTEVILYKGQALTVSSNSRTFEKKHHQHTLAICWARKGSAVRVLSGWWYLWPGTTDFGCNPDSPSAPSAPTMPTCLQEDTCWHRKKEDPWLLTSTQITQGSCLLKSRFWTHVPGVSHEFLHFQQVPSDVPAISGPWTMFWAARFESIIQSPLIQHPNHWWLAKPKFFFFFFFYCKEAFCSASSWKSS